MRKFVPVLLGISIPFLVFLYITKPKNIPIPTPQSVVKGVNVSFGDENVQNPTYSDFQKQKVEEITKSVSGQYSIYIKDLLTNNVISVGENDKFYAASLYKIPVAVVVLQAVETEKLELAKELTYTSEHYYSGSGKIQLEPFGTKFTVEELLSRLIKDSDNVAQSMLISEIDLAKVYYLMPSPEAIKTLEIGAFLESLYFGEYLNTENTARLLGYMSKTSFDNRISAGLVKGVTFSHKIGNWAGTGSWHDCGIVFGAEHMIVCLMSKNTTFEEFLGVSRKLGKLVFTF